ncbi:stressosome-associated protein Prli42 [Bacillus sp. AK128]
MSRKTQRIVVYLMIASMLLTTLFTGAAMFF